MPATAEQVLDQARQWIGYREDPPGSNRTVFGAWYGLDGSPWCAMFVSYCLARAGLPLAISTPKGFASTPLGARWFQRQGRAGHQPRPGALAFFHFPGGPDEPWRRVVPGRGGVHHVGIVETPHGPNGTVTCIEGNTADRNDRSGGRVLRRHRNPAHIVMYGYPPYTPTPAPPSVEEILDMDRQQLAELVWAEDAALYRLLAKGQLKDGTISPAHRNISLETLKAKLDDTLGALAAVKAQQDVLVQAVQQLLAAQQQPPTTPPAHPSI